MTSNAPCVSFSTILRFRYPIPLVYSGTSSPFTSSGCMFARIRTVPVFCPAVRIPFSVREQFRLSSPMSNEKETSPFQVLEISCLRSRLCPFAKLADFSNLGDTAVIWPISAFSVKAGFSRIYLSPSGPAKLIPDTVTTLLAPT